MRESGYRRPRRGLSVSAARREHESVAARSLGEGDSCSDVSMEVGVRQFESTNGATGAASFSTGGVGARLSFAMREEPIASLPHCSGTSGRRSRNAGRHPADHGEPDQIEINRDHTAAGGVGRTENEDDSDGYNNEDNGDVDFFVEDLPPDGFATNGLVLRWAKTNKNRVMAVAGGFGYTRNGESHDGRNIYWLCRFNRTLKCNGRITTRGQSVIAVTNDHSHPCDPNLVHVKEALSKISDGAVSSARAPRAVIGAGIVDLPDAAYYSMPPTKLLGQKVRRLRAKSAGQPEPADADSVVVPEKYQAVDPLGPSPTTQLFVLFDSKPMLPIEANGVTQEEDAARGVGRIILLATRNGLQRLENSEIWASDGTFKIRPPQFAQVYGIHGGNGRKMMPCAIALMAGQDRGSYNVMFGALRAAVENTPSLWSSDFEIAAFETVQEKFDCMLAGCFFHFMKSFHRRVQKTGLQQRYAEDAQFAAYLLQLPALAFVSPDCVEKAFIEIYSSDAYRNDPDLKRFARSWSQIWLGELGPDGTRSQPRFPVEMWNGRLRLDKGLPLTNNTVESWHRTAGLVVGRKPTVINFFHAAQCELKVVSLQAATEPVVTGPKLTVDAKRANKNLSKVVEKTGEYRSWVEFTTDVAGCIGKFG